MADDQNNDIPPKPESIWERASRIWWLFLIVIAAIVLYLLFYFKKLNAETFSWLVLYLALSFSVPLFFISFIRLAAEERVKSAREMIKNILEVITSYDIDVDATFGKDGSRLNKIFETMSDNYDPGKYIGALMFTLVVSMAGFYLVLARQTVLVDLGSMQIFLKELPNGASAAFLGAWYFSLFSIIARRRNLDISTSTVLNLGFQMLFATVAGYMSTEILNEKLAFPIAFGIGFIPYGELVDWIRSNTQKKLGIEAALTDEPIIKAALEPQRLVSLEGISRQELERLSDEGITTIQHLAFENPIRLHFATSYPMARVIDWIDQAYLRLYVDKENVEKLKKCGMRGAIELGEMDEYLKKLETDAERDDFLKKIAAHTSLDEIQLRQLTRQLAIDPQVVLLLAVWTVYGGS
ncbi:MAG: hypothetical protein O2944_09930 [Proteobacteria bacterium]|nr:hypothetical protein [Pseudomonadota bacterium]